MVIWFLMNKLQNWIFGDLRWQPSLEHEHRALLLERTPDYSQR